MEKRMECDSVMVYMKEIKDGKVITTIGEQVIIEATEYNALRYEDTYTTIVSCPSKEELDRWVLADEPVENVSRETIA